MNKLMFSQKSGFALGIGKAVVLIFALAIFLSMPLLASAGCCVSTADDSCVDAASESECGLFENFYQDDCSSVCEIGCCCEPGSDAGIAEFSVSCEDTYEFTPDSALSVGEACSCDSSQLFSISGSVVDKAGSPVSGATITASTSSQTATSDSSGNFLISDVPSGSVELRAAASDQGCLPGTRQIKLESDQTGVTIELECTCQAESCDPEINAYCSSENQWVIYDISISSEQEDYCSFCSNEDPADCGSPSECVDNDNQCPLGCYGYDNDCVCDNTEKNGLCPYMCGPDNDLDCNLYTGECGDGVVNYPYETCEASPLEGQLSLCTAEQCEDCNCAGFSECGNLVLESGEKCEIGMMCADGSSCEDCQCGALQCTGDARNPVLTTEFNYTEKNIVLEWSLPAACGSLLSGLNVYRCKKETENDCLSKNSFSRLAGLTKSADKYTDGSVVQQAEYCYYISAGYLSGSPAESDIKCSLTGSYYCLEDHPEEFCIDNKRMYCDENYNIQMVANGDCNPYKYCMGPDAEEKTWCANNSLCDQCSGLYGMFANLDLTVYVTEGEYELPKYCYPGSGRELVAGCFLDRTRTLFSSFNYCAYVSSCYDYKSEDACTDPADPCDKNSICEWLWVDENYPELGGICRPSAPELQRCDYCDEEEYNWITPGCTPESCSLFGDCHYQGASSLRSNIEPCTKESTATCLDYGQDQAACTGGRPVEVDAVYENNIRVSGTHSLTPSQDELGMGKCYFTANGFCRRNADNNPDNDCPMSDTNCLSDFSSPETELLASTIGVYPAKLNARYIASDENYAFDRLATYFCVAGSRTDCYPDVLADSEKKMFIDKIEESGDYTLYYYSVDPAKNLEPVKSVPITVDAERPFINITDPADEETATNQVNPLIIGETSLDSRFVCAQNLNTEETSCINNCLLTNGQAPCFSEENGVFELTLSLEQDDNLTDIVFYAVDFAGNMYQNTYLGILLDIEPPDEPIITIEPYS